MTWEKKVPKSEFPKPGTNPELAPESLLPVGKVPAQRKLRSRRARSPKAPRILIIEENSSLRNVLVVLLESLGCDTNVAHGGRQALAMICREDFDVVVFDLGCSDIPPETVMSTIEQIRPDLVDRILAVTNDMADRAPSELIDRYRLPLIRASQVAQDINNQLKALLHYPH